MEVGERDPITGRTTTGHEWNGIKELTTPVPRVVMFFLLLGTAFSIVYWLLMPAWPLWTTYTKGLLGNDQRAIVANQVETARVERAAWLDKVQSMDFDAIKADPVLMERVKEFGHVLFTDNCAACHGMQGTGGPGFPDLTAKAWLFGGEPTQLEETISVGINSNNDDTRVSQMLAFGRDGLLDNKQINDVVAYVRSLSGASAPEQRVAEGKAVFAANCVSCHGEDAKGMQESGAPDLTDRHWIYGGSANEVMASVYRGRQGHMPHWKDRLTPAEIKLLAIYVGELGDTK